VKKPAAKKMDKKVIAKAKPAPKKVVKAKTASTERKNGDPSSYMSGPAVLHYDIDWDISFEK
jgi:hypothetical protein